MQKKYISAPSMRAVLITKNQYTALKIRQGMLCMVQSGLDKNSPLQVGSHYQGTSTFYNNLHLNSLKV